MRSLTRSYNRTYYRRVIWVKVNYWQKLARLYVAANLTRLAFWVSVDFKKELRAQYNREYERDYGSYYGID